MQSCCQRLRCLFLVFAFCITVGAFCQAGILEYFPVAPHESRNEDTNFQIRCQPRLQKALVACCPDVWRSTAVSRGPACVSGVLIFFGGLEKKFKLHWCWKLAGSFAIFDLKVACANCKCASKCAWVLLNN